MNELYNFINKTADILKTLFIKYFNKKNEIDILKIKKILSCYFVVISEIKKKHDIKDLLQTNKKNIFINNCYWYVTTSSKINKIISEDNIKDYIKK